MTSGRAPARGRPPRGHSPRRTPRAPACGGRSRERHECPRSRRRRARDRRGRADPPARSMAGDTKARPAVGDTSVAGSSRATAGAGSRSWNVDPTPTVEVTVSSPPISRARFRLIVRPSPVPPRRATEASPWLKASKMACSAERRDARAGIVDAASSQPACQVTRDTHLAALGELQAVGREVDQDLLQPLRVDEQPRRAPRRRMPRAARRRRAAARPPAAPRRSRRCPAPTTAADRWTSGSRRCAPDRAGC